MDGRDPCNNSEMSASTDVPIRMSPRRQGIPPSHPNNPTPIVYPPTIGSSLVPSHSRSLSQPSFFSLDCLPPLSPSQFKDLSNSGMSDFVLGGVSMEAPQLPSPSRRNRISMATDRLPPRKGHRRSNSDIPLGYLESIQSEQFRMIPNSSMKKPTEPVKQESHWVNNGNGDDLVDSYMNLDNTEPRSSGASGSKTNGGDNSDNEVESPADVNLTSNSPKRREKNKRNASEDEEPIGRHQRSVSMDSYMGNIQFDEELLKADQPIQNEFIDMSSKKINIDSVRGDFSQVELKKIVDDEKLAEIALSDPKRAKRILANRQSAARSKERKLSYIAELEHKVQTLQTEATTLSAQITVLQRDTAGLANQHNELRFRLQAMEQQARLKDALNEALASEVQRLKLIATGQSGDNYLSNRMAQQLSVNSGIFPNQADQNNIYQPQFLTQQWGPQTEPGNRGARKP